MTWADVVKGFWEAWDWIGDNAGTLVALLTAAFTFQQFWVARSHNRVSVRPLLHVDERRDYTTKGRDAGVLVRYEATLSNHGLGPALVTGVSLYLNAQSVDASSAQAVEAAVRAALDHPVVQLQTATITNKRIFRATERSPLVTVVFHADSIEKAERVIDRLNQLHGEIRYDDLYGGHHIFKMSDR
jgi:hypothetical protein